MKHSLIPITVATLLGTGTVYAATGQHILLPNTANCVQRPSIALAAPAAAPCPDSTQPLRAGVQQGNEMIIEDFGGVPDGAYDTNGRCTTYVASKYYEPGPYMPQEYTSCDTWMGQEVYAGKDGTVVIQPLNSLDPGYLMSPIGDYSGDLTVKVRMRVRPYFWQDQKKWETNPNSGATLSVYPIKGGEKPTWSNSDIEQTTGDRSLTLRIYPNDGWVQATFTFRNYDADSDGSIAFCTAQAVEIDWITITDDCTYLAAPHMQPESNFTDKGFTANWDPVRRAFSYAIDLFKQQYSPDKPGVDLVYDFEDGQLPEGVACNGGTFVDGEGEGCSRGLSLSDGTVFVTPDFGVKLTDADFGFKCDGCKSNQTLFYIEGLDDDGNWQSIWYYPGDYVVGQGYFHIVLDEASIGGKYNRLRFYGTDLGQDNTVLLDNVSLHSVRPYDLVRVYPGGRTGNVFDPSQDYAYDYFAWTDDYTTTSFAFTGLDMNQEYSYRIRSHHMSEFNSDRPIHAFGIATPQLGKTDVDPDGSFTLFWTDVAKGQAYTATNYKAKILSEDEEEAPLLTETFSNAEGGTTIAELSRVGSSELMAMDAYTDNPGWLGQYALVGQNMIGGGAGGGLITPPIMSVPGRQNGKIYLMVIGKPLDQIKFYDPEIDQWGWANLDADGYFGGEIDFPFVRGHRLHITTARGADFALQSIEFVQDLKAGDLTLGWQGEQTVEPGVQQATFSNLDPDSYYAATVTSSYTFERKTIQSAASDPVYIDLVNGTGSTLGVSSMQLANTESHPDAYEVARYAVDGKQVGKDYRGLVIIRMSDGLARKLLVK